MTILLADSSFGGLELPGKFPGKSPGFAEAPARSGGASEVWRPTDANAPPVPPCRVPCRPPDAYYGRESISIFSHTNEFVGN